MTNDDRGRGGEGGRRYWWRHQAQIASCDFRRAHFQEIAHCHPPPGPPVVNFWRENNEKVTLKRVQNYRYIYLLDDVLIGERGRKMEAWWQLRTRGGVQNCIKLYDVIYERPQLAERQRAVVGACRCMRTHTKPNRLRSRMVEKCADSEYEGKLKLLGLKTKDAIHTREGLGLINLNYTQFELSSLLQQIF